jgi:hypothetical protein
VSDDTTAFDTLRDLIHQLALNVAVLTNSVDDMRSMVSGLRESTASKESVDGLKNSVSLMQVELKNVDEKHDKKWDRLLWAVFSLVLGAVVLAALNGGLKP